MTQREIDHAASAILAHPEPHHRIEPRAVHLNADDDDLAFGFERNELRAMAACVAIGGLFAVAVQFLPMLAKWIVS